MSQTTTEPRRGSYLVPSIEHATVADAMHPGIYACDPDATVTEVARLLAARHVHCVAVVGISHREPQGGVWGIVSDHDLVGAVVHTGIEDTAASLAQASVVSVTPETPLKQAAELMLAHGTGHLVVIAPESQRPVGIISTLDIAGVLAWGEG